jgi:hypothetical protein
MMTSDRFWEVKSPEPELGEPELDGMEELSLSTDELGRALGDWLLLKLSTGVVGKAIVDRVILVNFTGEVGRRLAV